MLELQQVSLLLLTITGMRHLTLTDRAVEPHDGSIVVAWWDGGFTMKLLEQ